jgi:ABC-type dipeptide/oligopeptide/nickel transport system permease component
MDFSKFRFFIIFGVALISSFAIFNSKWFDENSDTLLRLLLSVVSFLGVYYTLSWACNKKSSSTPPIVLPYMDSSKTAVPEPLTI